MNASLPIAVHVFITMGDKVLLMKRAGTGFNDDKWSIPAGRLEEGESITEAAIREVKEEVGLLVDKSNLGIPLIMHHKDMRGERIYVFFRANKWSGEVKNMEPDKCGEVKWFDRGNFPETIIDHIKYSFDMMEKGLSYIEYGFEL